MALSCTHCNKHCCGLILNCGWAPHLQSRTWHYHILAETNTVMVQLWAVDNLPIFTHVGHGAINKKVLCTPCNKRCHKTERLVPHLHSSRTWRYHELAATNSCHGSVMNCKQAPRLHSSRMWHSHVLAATNTVMRDWLPIFTQVGHGTVMYLLQQTLSWFNYELQTGSPSLLK